MIRLSQLFLLFVVTLTGYIPSLAQPPKECTDCFHSEIISFSKEEGCPVFEIKVWNDEPCSYALSHLTFTLPCYTIINGGVSEKWKIEVKKNEFKVDDIKGFAEDGKTGSFTFWVKACPDGDCDQSEENKDSDDVKAECLKPVITYKAALCFTSNTLNVNCPTLSAEIEKQDATCNGADNGALSVRILDGVAPYSYEWSNKETSPEIKDLSPGKYQVRVTDASGQTVNLAAEINEPEALKIRETVVPASCSDMKNGSIVLDLSGGQPPYKVEWSDGEEGVKRSELAPGSYEARVTDVAGCAITQTFEVASLPEIEVEGLVTPVSCTGEPGSIDLTVTGGSPPYQFAWSTGSSEEDVDGLKEGRHYVRIHDDLGCAAIRYFDVPVADNITIKLTSKKTDCTDKASGSIQAEISGGKPPYTYAWSNGATGKDISGLTTGQYALTVTDENGCVKEAKATIEEDKMQMYVAKRMPVCHGDDNGVLDVTIINGVEPVIYEWSNGAKTQDIDNLTAGTYSLTATDARGCSVTAAHYLPQPSPIILTARISGTECSGKWGTVELTAKGGGGSFKYNWSTGDLTKDLHNAAPGDYQVTVTDQYGCSAMGDFTVKPENITPPDLSCTILQPEITPVCGTENNKLLALSETAITYRWEIASSDGSWEIRDGQNTAMLTYKAGNENSSATFKLTTTNVNGCESTCELQLTACEPVEEPDNCGKGFFAQVTENKSLGDCQRYTVQISRADAIKYELSHLVIEPPCGEIMDFENSGGWKIEKVTDDKTTGMSGFKIDDIDKFGKSDQEYFTISFTVCETAMCDAPCWTPVIGYKAGPCVTYDTLPVVCHTISSSPGLKVSASGLVTYPNPARGPVSIQLPGQINGKIRIEIINVQGVKYHVLERHIESDDPVNIDTDNLPNDVYIVKILAKNEAVFGRFILLR